MHVCACPGHPYGGGGVLLHFHAQLEHVQNFFELLMATFWSKFECFSHVYIPLRLCKPIQS